MNTPDKLSGLVSLVFLCTTLFAGCDVAHQRGAADAGGVSFDFEALSAARFREDGTSSNLLAGAEWSPNGGTHGSLRREGGVWSIVAPTEADDGERSMWDAWVDLGENDDGMSVRISYRYRSHRADGRDGNTYTILWDADGPGTYSTACVNVTDDCWHFYAREFKVKPGVKRVRVCQRLDGPGDFEFREISMRRVAKDPQAPPVEVLSSPHGLLDRTFAVSSNQCAIIHYVWRKPEKAAGDVSGDYVFSFELSPGFEVIEVMFGDAASVKTSSLPGGGSLTTVRSTVPPEREFNSWHRYGVMVTSRSAVGTYGHARMGCSFRGKPCSNVDSLDLFVIPEIKARRPKLYMNGYSQASPSGSAPVTEVGRRAYARLVGDAGLGFADVSRSLAPYLREAGVPKVLGGVKAYNGFLIGERIPKEERFVALSNWHPGMDDAACPASVYLEKPHFVTNTVPSFRRQLEGFDGAICNWEPFFFSQQGCMCDTCCREFAKWAKVDYAEVSRDWPDCIDRKKGRFGGDLIRRFRSWQHGRVVKTVARYVVRFSGEEKSMGLIPEVFYGMMSSNWREVRPFDEFEVQDYAGGLRWINPWGPYSGVWDQQTPYVHQPADWTQDFFVARNVAKAARADFPHLKIMSFPSGFQCGGWVVEPEILEMNLEAYFFNGWDASCVYFFPVGYDNRYWAAVARATTMAADYERFVWGGRRIDELVEVSPSGSLAKTFPASNRHVPEYRNVSLLQRVAYERDGERIVAVFNYSAKEAAEVVLGFTDRGRRMRVSVPAARCAVFDFKR